MKFKKTLIFILFLLINSSAYAVILGSQTWYTTEADAYAACSATTVPTNYMPNCADTGSSWYVYTYPPEGVTGWYFTYASSCTPPLINDQNTGACVTAPAVGTTTPIGSGQYGVPETGECVANWPVNVLLTDAEMVSQPDQNVNGGCIAVANPMSDGSLYCVDHPQNTPGTKLCQYTMTGTPAGSETIPSSETIGTTPNDSSVCVTNPNTSVETCLNIVDDNCGTFNGEFICTGSIPGGTCASSPNGNIVCTEGNAPPLNVDGSTKTGEIISSKVDVNGVVSTITYYSSNNTNSNTQGLDDIKNGQCGSPGQPACKIDETGMPTTFGDVDTSSLDSYTTNIGSTTTTPLEPINSLSLGTQSACNANQFDFNFRNNLLKIDICQAIEMIRDALWYFFAGLTIIYLLNLWDLTIRSAK